MLDLGISLTSCVVLWPGTPDPEAPATDGAMDFSSAQQGGLILLLQEDF